MNLNHARLPTDGPSQPLENPSTRLPNVDAEVVFRDLQHRLVELIESYPVVVGCVAWLTSCPVLEALATRRAVSIIVQKEDFLRPDHYSNRHDWGRRLRERYNFLADTGPVPVTRYIMPAPLCDASVCSTPTIEPIRCVGNHNSSRSPAHPRMHNKFLVLGRFRSPGGDPNVGLTFHAEAVWTGSFNLTETGANSFENAVIIRDERIAAAYALEYAQIAVLSEPLDWKTEWMAPEWRIGT